VAFSRPPVAIVGAGVVAQALGRLLSARGEPVVAVAARNRDRGDAAARFIGASTLVRVVTFAEVPDLATHVVVAVSDDGITPVAEALAAAGLVSGVVLHTCGARGPEALAPLRDAGVSCGMLHPLQSFVTPEQGVRSLVEVTFGLCGDSRAIAWAEHIVGLLHGRSLHVEADRLSYYHAAAVMASGGLVAAIDAALLLLEQAGIGRDTALGALGPLARTSVDNALGNGPTAALSGPVVRGDATTVASHLRAVEEVDPTVGAVYRAVTAHLIGLARQRGLPDVRMRAMQSLLATPRAETVIKRP
jgi:predicted short-subunit dehydrogenase-like oxidoreductase (DUF2520 family)